MAKSSKKRKEPVQVEKQTKKQLAIGRKEARQTRIILISVAVLIALVVVIGAVGVIQELILKPNQPVATVNGVPIRADDYGDPLTYSRYNYYTTLSNLQQSLQELNASPEENAFLISFYEQQQAQLQSAIATLPDTTLDSIIDTELVGQKAEEEGLTVSKQEVDEAIDADLRRAFETTSQQPITTTEQLPTPTPTVVPQKAVDDLYKTVLGNMKLSENSFRAIVRNNLLQGKLQELLASQVLTTGLVANVNLIKTETMEQAEAAKARIEGGEEFAVVAREVSTDTLTAEDGGAVGWVTTGQLSERYGEPVETLVFSGETGKLAIVESNGAFYVLRVSERDENGPLPGEVLTQRQNSALDDWLAERKASPDVLIERLLQPDQIPADPFSITSSQ